MEDGNPEMRDSCKEKEIDMVFNFTWEHNKKSSLMNNDERFLAHNSC